MKYTMKDFEAGKVAVHTGNGEDYCTFMRMCSKYHYRWNSGDKPMDFVPVGLNHDTVIFAREEKTLLYGNVDYAFETDVLVISVDDIIDEPKHQPKHQIVIDFNGNVTTARMMVDGKVVKETTAKCAPCDKFNFHTGAEVAFNRLWEKKEKEEKEEKTDSAPFKIGDSVRYTGDNVFSGPKRGATGKVIAYGSNFIGVYLVEFDEPVKGGHDGVAIIRIKDGKHGRNGHCWWCPNCFIERI